MIEPRRAVYGVKDNMHAVLAWDGPALPALLAGLTDRPPGSLAPGESWWPSVGCGPVESWWALWWTVPDVAATRSGMVRSEVALWPLEDVAEISDLRPVMALLSGGEIASPEPDLLAAVAAAVLAESASPPVVADLAQWPGILAALWQPLWPAARRAFAARVALSPPQGGDSMLPPWLFATPPERALQWWEHPVVRVGAPSPLGGRGVAWLRGESNPSLAEIVTSCDELASRSAIRRAVRAADRLDAMRHAPGAEVAVDLLRTLSAVAPRPELATVLKQEAMTLVERDLPVGSFALLYSLANLDAAAFPLGVLPAAAVRTWVGHHACDLDDRDLVRLMTALVPARHSTWWSAAARDALRGGLACTEAHWAVAAVRWLGRSDSALVVSALVPETVEQQLVDAAPLAKLTATQLDVIRDAAREHRWPRLHAWAVMHTLLPAEAFQVQLSFRPDPLPGLALLVERLPGDTVVAETVRGADPRLISMTVKRTLLDPGLMRPLDPSLPGWRALWAAHVAAGGDAWPPGGDRQTLGHAVLDACLGGGEPPGVIATIAIDLAEQATERADRARLWTVISEPGRSALLRETARALLTRLGQGQPMSRPEEPVERALLEELGGQPPAPQALAGLLSSGVGVDEATVVRWLRKAHSLAPAVASAIGTHVAARGWQSAARELYRRGNSDSSFHAAAVACQDLLSRWDRFRLAYLSWSGSSPPVDKTALVERVTELGAELLTDSLSDLWQRAGGKRSTLSMSASPLTQWRTAANAAYYGALRDGLSGLVREMRHSLPHNTDLRELDELLASSRTQR